MTEKQFIEELQKLNINLNDKQKEQFDRYYKLLVLENEKTNLTRIIEKKDVYLKHFYDSATVVKIIDLNKEKTLCCVGTGAGFPGVVLKILFPHLEVVLIDSLNKRILFLNKLIKEINLENIEAIHIRAEEFGKKNRNKFDVVTTRAVGSLNILLEYCIPITKVDKHFIAMKGNIENVNKRVYKKLNCQIINLLEFNLIYENSKRSLLKIKKLKDNLNFPRTFNKIKSNPLI